MHLNRCASTCNTQFILLVEPAWICRSPPGLCGPRQGRPVHDDHGSQTPPSPASCNSMTRDMKAMPRSSPVSWASARVSEKVDAKGSEDYAVRVHALYFYYRHHPVIFRKRGGLPAGPPWVARACTVAGHHGQEGLFTSRTLCIGRFTMTIFQLMAVKCLEKGPPFRLSKGEVWALRGPAFYTTEPFPRLGSGEPSAACPLPPRTPTGL